jgi:hypothetical protein
MKGECAGRVGAGSGAERGERAPRREHEEREPRKPADETELGKLVQHVVVRVVDLGRVVLAASVRRRDDLGGVAVRRERGLHLPRADAEQRMIAEQGGHALPHAEAHARAAGIA